MKSASDRLEVATYSGLKEYHTQHMGFNIMRAIVLYIVIVGLLVTAMVTDGNSGQWGWMAVDFLLSPVGVVRGLLILLGLAG